MFVFIDNWFLILDSFYMNYSIVMYLFKGYEQIFLLFLSTLFSNIKVIMEEALQMVVLHLVGNWKLVNWL